MIESGQLIQVSIIQLKVIGIVLSVVRLDPGGDLLWVNIGTLLLGEFQIHASHIIETNIDRKELHEKLKKTYSASILGPTHTPMEKTQ